MNTYIFFQLYIIKLKIKNTLLKNHSHPISNDIFYHKMDSKECILCKRKTVSVISTDEGSVCYTCYTDKKHPSKKKRKYDNEEARIQAEFFEKVPLFFPTLPDRLLFAIPNGGSRNKIEAANLKRQGVKRGVTDVLLQIPKKGYASLCIEFKTPKGRQSDEQKEYQRQVEMAGSKYVIVRSVEQAIKTMQSYLK